jgi:predicted DNA binding CopG/RHH family protein
MSAPDHDEGKPFPVFTTDEEAERFLETADLSEYDFSGFRPAHFTLRRKDARVNMRMPQPLLTALKAAAAEDDIPYQRLLRDFIERGLAARDKARRPQPEKAS